MTGQMSERYADTGHVACWQGGRRKITFQTKAAAKRYITSGRSARSKPLRPYRCKDCKLWHLTSQVGR